MSDLEIIEFVRPDGNRKNLFISSIPSSASEADIYEKLCRQFSRFGLIYEIQVFPTHVESQTTADGTLVDNGNKIKNATARVVANVTIKQERISGYYAFVKFYSSLACRKAREMLSGCLLINGQQCKISYSKRRKVPHKQPLSLAKCQELALNYLGFNGWSSKIRLQKEDEEYDNGKMNHGTQFICLVEVSVTNHHVSVEGFGVWEEPYVVKGSMNKAIARCKCRKISYQRALVDAFSKLILIVLQNGKVAVEVDTRKPDIFVKDSDDGQLLQIQNLDAEPELDSEADSNCVPVCTADMDDFNLLLLQQLDSSKY